MAEVLHLSFNGTHGSTTITDSVAGKTATVGGGAALSTTEKVLGTAALRLDGSGDYLTYADSADWELGSNSWEVQGFFRLNAVGAQQTIFNMRATGNHIFNIYVSSSNFLCWHVEVAGGAWGAGADINSATALVVGRWYYFKLKKSGTTVTLLLATDLATLVSQGTLAVGAGAGPTGTFLVAFGAEVTDVPAISASNQFNGWIDEFIVNNGAVTADVVPAVPRNGFFNVM